MREKKELMKSVENKNNVRNEKVQQVLEMYKSIIDNYIEKKLLETVKLSKSNSCTILFCNINNIIKKEYREFIERDNVEITEDDIFTFLKNRRNELKDKGYITKFNNYSMKIYMNKIQVIIDKMNFLINPLTCFLTCFIFALILFYLLDFINELSLTLMFFASFCFSLEYFFKRF